MIRDSDTHCLRGYRLSHNTSSKVKTQGSNHKDSPHSEESKSKDLKSAPLHDNMAKLARKEGKKKKKSQEHR